MLALESQVEEKDLKLNNLEIINEMNKDQAILPKVVLTQIIHYLTKDVSIFTQDKEYLKTHCAQFDDEDSPGEIYNEMWNSFVGFQSILITLAMETQDMMKTRASDFEINKFIFAFSFALNPEDKTQEHEIIKLGMHQ